MHKNPDWPANSVKPWPIGNLRPYGRNARTHSPEQVDQIAASISEWGFTNPILAQPDGTVIAGHGRLLAAQKLGLEAVPVMVAKDWTAEQVRAYVIADNQLALNAGWDEALLKLELGELDGAGFDVNLLGFSPEELAAIAASGAEHSSDPDDVPQPEAVAASQLGDVWLLEGHRLVCGDSTDEAAVRAAVGQEKPHLMVTDPPYGVDYDANWRNERARTCEGMGNRAIGAGAVGKVLNDNQADWRAAYELFPGDVAYAWSAGLRSKEAIEGLEAAGFEIRAQIIWAKQQFAIGRGHYHFQHEPCWYAVRKGATGHWNGGRKQTTLWQIDKPQSSETGHSTQKPVECMRRPIVNNSKPGDAVYDPFLGSGTTLIAAEMEGRRCFGIELNPVYVDIIIKRWQQFTGKTATLEATGETLADRMPKQAAE